MNCPLIDANCPCCHLPMIANHDYYTCNQLDHSCFFENMYYHIIRRYKNINITVRVKENKFNLVTIFHNSQIISEFQDEVNRSPIQWATFLSNTLNKIINLKVFL